MKKIKRFASSMMAVILAGTLTVGSLSVAAFGAEDVGSVESTSVETSFEEATEEVETGVSDSAVSDTSEIAAEEAAVTSYTVTLDANGGYFANEMDDILNETLEKTEILNKIVPVGGIVSTVPLYEQEGITATFLGWSLERNGEILPQEQEGYAPVRDCVLYAVWKYEDAADTADTSVTTGEDVPEEVLNDPIETEEPEASVPEEEITQEKNDSEDVLIDETAAEETADEEPATYAVTLDANGGYFVNEWDDVLGKEVQSTEVLNKNIPIGEAVVSFPVKEQENAVVTFMGWSLERDGEIVSQADAEYIPVDNCVLYAVWQVEETTDTIDSGESSPVEPAVAENKDLDSADENTEQTEELDTDTGYKNVDETGVEQNGEAASRNIEENKSPLTVGAAVPETYSEDAVRGALASGTVGDALNWIVYEDGRLVISGTWGKNDTERPWSNYSFNKIIIESGITRIGANAFWDCSEVTNVTIPNTVTSIDFQAFRGCKNLTEVALPSSLTEIGHWVFYSCTGLERVTLSEGVTSIGEKAFYGCIKLKSVALPNGLETIGSASFYGCTSLTDVQIPDSVTSIGFSAFCGCNSLSEVKLPNKLNTIEYSTFSGCTSLTNVQIPDSVTSIGKHVFCRCTGLKEVKLPDSITRIGANSFMYCTGLTNCTIPSGVTVIEMDLFAGCTSLTVVEIPSSVTEIESYAFSGCTSLPKVVIPDGVKTIAYRSFDGCSSLTTIYFNGSAPSIDSIAFTGVTATAYYPASDPSWTEEIRQNYGGTITWVPLGMDDALILSPSELIGYVYTDDDWYSYANELGGSVKFFCNENNFWHVKVISDYDSSVGGVASDFFANFINGKEGWKELLTGDISEEDAEEILLALLNENGEDIANLAAEKTSTECQNILIKTFDYYLQLNAFDVYKRNKLKEYMSSDQFETALRTEGFEKSLEMALEKLDDVDESRVQEIISGFKASEELQLGLDNLDIGLYVYDKVKAGVDEYCKIAQIQAANELYTEMLENVRDNSNNDAVKKAAEKILKIQGESEKEAREQFLRETAGDVVDDIIIKALDEYSDQIWFLQAAKYGYNSGSYLANKWLHSNDINEQKRVMRISADVGDALSTWVMELSDESTNSENDFSKAEKAVCGLDMLATVRLNGENALKTMSSYLLFNAGEEESARSVHMIEEQISYSIKVLKTYHLELLKVACPVDIEVYSSNGSLIATIYDGTETRGKSGDVSYTVYYSEISDDYVKIISVPEDQGYYYRIKGIDTGYTSFDLSRLDDEGTMRCAFKKSVSSDDNTIIEVLPSNNLGDTQYKISKDNVNSTSGSLTVREDRRIPVTGISTGTTRCEITDDQKYAVSYEILPVNAVNQYVNWKSSNENVAMVGSNGVIVGISPGTATVTGTTDDGGYSISIDVVVNSNPIASGTCGDNLIWTLTKGGTLRITGTGEMNNYYDTTDARAPWYSYFETIKSVAIGKGVTNIGYGAFEGCSNLKSVTIPNSVTTIKGHAFKNCDNLTNVTIPDSVTRIDAYVFSDCSNLKRVAIPIGVTSIASGAFRNCSSLTSITIPDSVTSIGDNAFSFCSSLTSVTIPNSATSIGKYAFDQCSSLTSVTIPNSVTSIGENAFENCSSLTSVTIPSSVKSIDNSAFSRCSSLTSVTIPNSVTSIGKSAFSSCSSLKSITIPGSVTSIGDYAFNHCSSLKSITIPGSVMSIGDIAFGSCSSLTSVMIPNSVTSIANGAFFNCSSLTSVTIPNSVTSIGDNAFSFCSSLTSVTIPDSVTNIGDNVFMACPDKLLIYGVPGSSAEQYATKDNITFININAKSISSASISIAAQTYNGKPQTPDPVIKVGSTTLKFGTDYEVSYSNNTNAGTATVTITGKGNYVGTKTATFKINKADQSITAKTSAASIAVGKTATVSITGAKGTESFKSSDTSIATVDSKTGTVTAKKVGTVKITATSAATANYNAASKTITIKVVPASIAKATVTCPASKVWAGWALTPVPTVKLDSKTLKKGTDFSLAFTNNKNVGTATITITGKGNYTGTIRKTFKINPKPTSISKLTGGSKNFTIGWKKQPSQTSGYQIQYSSRSDFKTQKIVTVSGASKTSRTVSGLAKKHKYYVRIRTFKTVGKTKYYSTWSAAKTVTTK